MEGTLHPYSTIIIGVWDEGVSIPNHIRNCWRKESCMQKICRGALESFSQIGPSLIKLRAKKTILTQTKNVSA